MLINTAIPVRDLLIEYKTIKLKAKTKRFVEPKRTKNLLLVVLINVVEIVAACPLPNAGIKLHKGAVNNEASIGEIIIFRLSFIFSIFCSGRFIFVFILRIRDEAPNSPLKSGRSGSVIFEFKTPIPKNPEIINIRNAENLFLSVKIINKLEIIKINGMRKVTNTSSFGKNIINKGMRINNKGIANKLPKLEKKTAS